MMSDSSEMVDTGIDGSSDGCADLKVPLSKCCRMARRSRAHSLRFTSKIFTISSTRERSVQPRGVFGGGTTYEDQLRPQWLGNMSSHIIGEEFESSRLTLAFIPYFIVNLVRLRRHADCWQVGSITLCEIIG